MPIVPLGDVPAYHAARKPSGAAAVIYPEETLTWRELDERASRRAGYYGAQGVGPDDIVAVALRNSARFHETSFAIWKLGATPGIISPNLPEHEFQAILDLMKPKLVVTDSGRAPPGATAVSVLDLGDADAGPRHESRVATYWKAMTSGGSTGRPKIIVDHGRGEADVDLPIGSMGQLDPGDVVLNPGPLYHNAPFLFSSRGLAIGCKVVGMSRFDPEEALRLIEAHRVNWVTMVPTMMHRIWSLPPQVRARYDLSSLKAVWHMAAPCPPWLKEAWIGWLGPDRIFELYGGTEGTGATAISGAEWLLKRGSVGKPLLGFEAKAFREDGAPCAPGEVGEIYFKSPSAQRPSHYVGAELRQLGDDWASIGDLGHVDEDGYVFLADRRTDLILRGGANIYPAEVESQLDAHPAVASSIVVGLPCEEYGQRVHAIVQPREGAGLSLAELHGHLAARLAKYKLPESYELVAHPLRDDAGKARRSALREERVGWLREGRGFQSTPDG